MSLGDSILIAIIILFAVMTAVANQAMGDAARYKRERDKWHDKYYRAFDDGRNSVPWPTLVTGDPIKQGMTWEEMTAMRVNPQIENHYGWIREMKP